MKTVVLSRNGAIRAADVETSDLKAGRFAVGEHVMLGISGDCCWHSKVREEFEVASVEPSGRFGGGRETVTFRRVRKGGAK